MALALACSRKCSECQSETKEEFRKVLDLKDSGLLFYLYKNKDLFPLKKKAPFERKENIYVLHNVGCKDLQRSDYMGELCQYRTKCMNCKSLISRVRSLLDEITMIRKNEILGVCEYCRKWRNPETSCPRCNYIVKKFLANKAKECEERQELFKMWLCKVRLFLHAILGGEGICTHRLSGESDSAAELQRLLNELKTPLTMREPEIGNFPSTDPDKLASLETMQESKEMIEELLFKLKVDSTKRRYSSDESLNAASQTGTSCVCKLFVDKKYQGKISYDALPKPSEKRTSAKTEVKDADIPIKNRSETLKVTRKSSKISKTEKIEKLLKDRPKSLKEISTKDDKKPAKDAKLSKEAKDIKSPKEAKSSKKAKSPKHENQSEETKSKQKKTKLDASAMMFLRMIEETKRKKLNDLKQAKSKGLQLPIISELPKLPSRLQNEEESTSSASVLECGHNRPYHPVEMIKGNDIVQYDPHYKDEVNRLEPLFYKTEHICSSLLEPTQSTVTIQEQARLGKTTDGKSTEGKTTEGKTTEGKTKEGKTADGKTAGKFEISDAKGIIRYALSNREFIDKGWTQLPTTKIMRRMNIYKMLPANPERDWFQVNKKKGELFYDSGEKLAEIDKHAQGKWFYKSGLMALEYYKGLGQQRYIVYSSGEELVDGKLRPVTVLASFDHAGNGVIYDLLGNVRLKYNQSEGILYDEKIGPPGRWKWHTLNDPPVLNPISIDRYEKRRDECLDNILKSSEKENDNHDNVTTKEGNDPMLAIELENFAKEKAHKLVQKFKPFQIRMKAAKLNEQFSLRVIDQSNIKLVFRQGHICLKLNLGMILKSDEIVDTDTSEMSEVATPYDQSPPKSPSVAVIQNILKNAKKPKKFRPITDFLHASRRFSLS